MSFLRESEVYGVTVWAAYWNSAHVRHAYINYFLQFLSLSPLSATLPIYDEILTASDSLFHTVRGGRGRGGTFLTVPCLMFSSLSSLIFLSTKISEKFWLCLLLVPNISSSSRVHLQCGNIEKLLYVPMQICKSQLHQRLLCENCGILTEKKHFFYSVIKCTYGWIL